VMYFRNTHSLSLSEELSLRM